MNGILLIDKPAGITSHGVVSRLRKKLGTKKIGHVGTLDPSATGLLIMCVGTATKISSFLASSNKVYETDIVFGKVTTTYDAEGEIVSEKNTSNLTRDQVEKMIPKLTGKQLQKPPMYSAVKVAGKKLYQYARSNESIEVPEREVTIQSIELLSFSNPEARLRIACSKGTYVRSLVHDLGDLLGVGASVLSIRRLQSGDFSIANSVTLENFLEMEKENILTSMIPIPSVLQSHFETLHVSKEDEDRILHGVEYSKAKVNDRGFHSDSFFLFVSQETKKEIAIGRWGDKDRIEIKRVF